MCDACNPGTANPSVGQKQCDPCQAGFVTNSSGELSLPASLSRV
jgi:hypothetical protein